MIPCEQIYNYILNLANRKANVFFLKDFHTRGIDEFQGLCQRSDRQLRLWPVIICHDQEILDFDRHLDKNLVENLEKFTQIKSSCVLENLNLRWVSWNNIHDSMIITHSEKNSQQVFRYQQEGYEMVYFWSHALIARDWFRYGEHDPAINRPRRTIRDFLIYSRGWTGEREYRIKFAEMLIDRDIVRNSIYRIAKAENNHVLTTYKIQDSRYHSTRLTEINESIEDCVVNSDSSAIYCADDFLSTNISVVLETCFTPGTIHLTEKILRAIALGHPFLLAAGPGALDYLRSYGFETFQSAGFNEEYDHILDPIKRLEAIADEMHRIQNLDEADKSSMMEKARDIAKRNRERFYSQEFYDSIIEELKINLENGLKNSSLTAMGRKFLKELKYRRLLRGREYYKQRVLARPSYIRDLRIYRKRTYKKLKGLKTSG